MQKVKSYDQLSLLERVLLTECFGGQDPADHPQPVGYSLIVGIRHTGWICTLDDRMLNPDYYFAAPLCHHLDGIEGEPETIENSCSEIVIDDSNLVLPAKKPSVFGGQDQVAAPPLKFGGQAQDGQVISVFGEYWIELVYKTIKGIKYGPYRYQRWRDAQGRKRSRYLGKALKSAHGDATDSKARDRTS